MCGLFDIELPAVEDRQMKTRIKAMVVGAAALMLVACWSVSAKEAADKDAHGEHFTACAKACADCMRECESCAHHCAYQVAEGKKEHLTTLGTCADCGEFCAQAAKIVSRHGPMSVLTCESCAKACDVCGTACEKFPDDDHMKRCAKACRDCAKACRDMVGHAGHASAAPK
jgi:hypothetical protein